MSALIAVVIALVVTWIVIMVFAEMGGSGRPNFWHVLVTRYMGLIVIAMGVQFALSGWKAFGAA